MKTDSSQKIPSIDEVEIFKEIEMVKSDKLDIINISSKPSLPTQVIPNEIPKKQSFDILNNIKEYLIKLNIDNISNLSFLRENIDINALALLHFIAMSYTWGYCALPDCFVLTSTKKEFYFNKKYYESFYGDNELYFSLKDGLLNYSNILIKIKEQLVPIYDKIIKGTLDNEIDFDRFFENKNGFIVKKFYKFIFNTDLKINNINYDFKKEIKEIIKSMNEIDTYKKMLFKIIVLANLKITIDTSRPNKNK